MLNFNRYGVDGHIEIGKDDLHVSAKLGFLTAMFKEPIESEIKRVLKEKF